MVALNEPLLAQLTERLATRNVSGLRPLTGGASSLTFTGRHEDRPVVVKVAPPGVAPIAHRDVLRQARIVKALSRTAVPVPDIVFEDHGDPPEVPPLFVMAFLDGTSCEPLFDDADDGTDTAVAERYRSAAATMAHLHAVDPAGIGLAEERTVGPLGEVERWCRTLDTVDPTLAPGWEKVADALRAGAPAALPPAIVHGDFRLGNLLADGDRITAVIDWEIWSIGDPRIDAGWFLINCDPRTYRRSTRYAAAVPPLSELTAIYHTSMKSPMPQLDWFRALACFKSTATWSLIVKHNRRRVAPEADLESMAKALPHLLAQATEILA